MASVNEAQAQSTDPAATRTTEKPANTAIDSQIEAPAEQSTAEAVSRVLQDTDSWRPSTDRRQSWSREEQKHHMHVGSIGDVNTGPGFSESK